MTTNSPASWGLEPPPRNLETAPPSVKARLRYSHTVFVALSFIGAAAGSCLLTNAPDAEGWEKVVGLGLSALFLALGPILIGHAFSRDTRTSLRDGAATRFVVVSVEKVGNIQTRWRGHHVALKGVDQPALEAGVLTHELPADFAADAREVVGLASTRGEFLIVGLSERHVLSARPSAKVPRHLMRGAW